MQKLLAPLCDVGVAGEVIEAAAPAVIFMIPPTAAVVSLVLVFDCMSV
eukprot:CAMPEP_0176475848 /NCGR_PEP_ID=MMETSP0127-20121128/43825_1 /TAXON_ID=938130 /ORGANISM="Platyophrya macrostoma, Strain WH" /LENGTH=47 /DNA_ID= /DNA_START= /DNA_END= /DNA_ORIENTATION=